MELLPIVPYGHFKFDSLTADRPHGGVRFAPR
jgi:hypothetical protein